MRRQHIAPARAADLREAEDTEGTKYVKRVRNSSSYGGRRRRSADGTAVRWFLWFGLVTRFYALKYPQQVVFDEYHFGKFVNGYVTGQYFFDIHPPLGKLFIAAAAWWSGYDGTQPFAKIGEVYQPDVDLFALRAVPATFGALLIPLVYLLVRQLGCSVAAASLAAGIVLLDGAILVESRLLLTDSALLFFGLLQFYCALRAASAPRFSATYHGYLAATGIAIGATVSVRAVRAKLRRPPTPRKRTPVPA